MVRGLDSVRLKLCRERLRRRRAVAARTLNYVDAEREIVAVKSGSMCGHAQHQRQTLFDEIGGRYEKEIKKIDAVLERIDEAASREDRSLLANR